MDLNVSADLNAQSSSSKTAQDKHIAILPPSMKFNTDNIYMNAVRGQQSVGYTFVLQNRSSSSFKLVTESFIFDGPDADKFQIVGGRIPRTIQPGAKAVFKVSVKPDAGDAVGSILTARLYIKASRASGTSGYCNLRGLVTAGEGGSLEPSLQQIFDLYNYDIRSGDSNPNDTNFDNADPSDEIFAQRFEKAGSAEVKITPIAQFVSYAAVPGRLGIYTPGSPDTARELFSLNEAFNQSVAPEANGPLTFDPGGSPFSVYAQIPVFVDNGSPRRIYGEDTLNTWEADSNARRKVRVYPLKINGNTQDNSYVVTFEDYTLAKDQNDYVYVIQNVTPVTSGPEIGLTALNGQPFADRLAFNEIGTKNSTIPNRVLNQATVRINNTGNRDLTLNSVTIAGANASDFQIVGGPANGTVIPRYSSLDVTVKFVATAGDTKSATLVINSDDRDEGTTNVALTGFWQSVSESDSGGVNQEPDLEELGALLGYSTKFVYSGQSLDTNGRPDAVGEEIISDYWQRADTSYPVKVTDLATYHTQGNTDELAWYLQGQPWYGSSDPRNTGNNGPRNTLYFTGTNDGQTLLPRTTGGVSPAVGTFSPSGAFGFRLSGEFSDDSLNVVPSGAEDAHHWRFYPARRADGSILPNTYIGVMDFSAINYDFNDNFFLIENVRPAEAPSGIFGAAGYESNGNAVVDWDSIYGIKRYGIARSDSSDGTYSTLSTNLGDSFYVDTTATAGHRYYYRVWAIDGDGTYGEAAQTFVSV